MNQTSPAKKRRQSDGASLSPKTPEARLPIQLGAQTSVAGHAECDDIRIGAELGSLAATTARHPKFASSAMYGPLLSSNLSDEEDWLTLNDAPRRKSRVKLISIDCEMCERISDGVQLPISAAMVAIGPGAPERVIFHGLIDPLTPKDKVFWKTEIHGISAETIDEAKESGRLFSGADLHAILVREWDDLTFLVGHSLSVDLKVLKIRGGALHRRVIDTMLVHWSLGAPSLAALTGVTTHDALEDARAAASVVLSDIGVLIKMLAAPAYRANRTQRQTSALVPGDIRQTCAVFIFVPEFMVGRVIGKKGATLDAIRESNLCCTVDVAAKGAVASSKRKVTVRADSTSAVARCLAILVSHVPELKTACASALASISIDKGSISPADKAECVSNIRVSATV